MINLIRNVGRDFHSSEYTLWEIKAYITWNAVPREIAKLKQYTLTVL